MTQKEFWEALGHTKNWGTVINDWPLDYTYKIRNKKCDACPITYLANKKKKKVNYFNVNRVAEAAAYLGLNPKFAIAIILAADGHLDRTYNVISARNKLMKVCGLK